MQGISSLFNSNIIILLFCHLNCQKYNAATSLRIFFQDIAVVKLDYHKQNIFCINCQLLRRYSRYDPFVNLDILIATSNHKIFRLIKGTFSLWVTSLRQCIFWKVFHDKIYDCKTNWYYYNFVSARQYKITRMRQLQHILPCVYGREQKQQRNLWTKAELLKNQTILKAYSSCTQFI